MADKQLENPKGAFGYGTTSDADDALGVVEEQRVRNASTANAIPVGAAVIWSSASTVGNRVNVTTVAGNPRFAGVARTSAAVNGTTLGEDAEWLTIRTKGVVRGALLTGSTAGALVGISATTIANLSSNGGLLGDVTGTTAPTATPQAAVGMALSSGTTGTTGFLTTVGPRGIVRLFGAPVTIPQVSS